MKKINIKIKKLLLLVIVLANSFLFVSFAFASLVQDNTCEIYLAPGQNILSKVPNTLSVNDGVISVVLNDGSNIEVQNKKENEQKFKIADYYITVKYLSSNQKLCIYNHGKKIKTIPLKHNFKIKDFVSDLTNKYDKGQITYFKNKSQSISQKRIVNNYYKTYPKVKEEPPPTLLRGIVIPESNLAQFMVLTTNGVLSFSASNINNGNTPASSTITTALWTDLTSSMGNNGVLTNFPQPTGSTNSYSGWDGLNSVSTPSVLKFGGEISIPAPAIPYPNYIDTGTDSNNALRFSLTNSFSVETWLGRDNLNQPPYSICGPVAGNGHISSSGGAGTRGYYLSVEGGCSCTSGATPTNMARFAVVDSSSTYKYSETSALDYVAASQSSATCTVPQQIPFAAANPPKLTAGNWHHIVGTWDGTNIKTYLDGVPDSTVTTMGSVANITSTSNFLVGTAPGLSLATSGSSTCITDSVYFMGQVGRLRVYNAALTDTQVRQNYIGEAYRFQCSDILVPGIKGDEDFINATYKKAGDTFNVYVSDSNSTPYGDNDVASISSISCKLGTVSLSTPTPTELNYSGGLAFDGTDDYIQLGNILNQTTNDFTLEALVKMPYRSLGVENILCKRDPSNSMNAGFQIFKNASGFVGAIIGDGTADRIEVDGAQYGLTNNKWHHIAAVFNRKGNLTIYVDGMADGSDSISSEQGSISNSADLRIGQNSASGETFRGNLANVRIYNRALSAEEISRNSRYRYEPVDFHNLTAWWKMDDSTSNPGTNTVAAKKWDTTTNAVIADSSLNGTLTNFSLISTSTNGWANQFQYAYNINKYIFTVPTLPAGVLNQLEEFNCTLTDAATNTTTEEVSDVFVTTQPTVFTSIVSNNTYKLADTFTITALDSSPATGLFTNPTVPTATLDGSTVTTCNLTSFATLKKAITLDGVNDYISVGSVGSGIRTISFWVNPASTTTNFLELSSSINVTASGATVMATGITNSTIYVNGVVSNNLAANAWQHIVIISDADLNASDVNLGRVGNSYYNGQFDDVQLYSRALSSNEIVRMYNTPGRPINAYKLDTWLRFERLEDTNNNNVVDNIRDYSGSGKNGTLNNFATLASSLVDSTISNTIDGTTGSCDVTITSTNPPGSLNANGKSLTVSAANALTQTGTETKIINLLRDQKPATPTIVTASVDSTPLGTTGPYTVGLSQTLSLNFIAADPDIGNTVTLSLVTPAEAGTFTSNAVSNPGTAKYTFTPGPSHNGMTYSIAVLATDNVNSTSLGNLPVSFTVTLNTPPTKPTITSASVDAKDTDKGGSYSINLGQKLILNFNATDPDIGSSVALSLVNSPGLGTFTPGSANGTGSFTYIPTNSDDAGMTFNFNVRAIDNFGVSAAQDLTFSVTIVKTGVVTTAGGTTTTGSGATSSGQGSNNSATSTGPIIIIQPSSSSSSGSSQVVITPEDLNNLPVINNINFLKVPSSYTEGIQEDTKVILANSENAFLIPKDTSITENLLALKLSQAKVSLRVIDKAGKEFNIFAFPFLTGADTNPIVVQTKIFPDTISDGDATLILIVNNKPVAKFTATAFHSPLKAQTASLTNLLKPQIPLIQVTRKLKSLKLVITGANIFDKEIFKDGETIPADKTQTSIALLPQNGLELKTFKISKISKIRKQSIIRATYSITDSSVAPKVTLSVLNPYGQTLKTIDLKSVTSLK